MIFVYVAMFLLGIFILIKSSDILVEGASSIASKFNVSPLVIGLTIVAFGTSAPELVVSVSSALSGSTDIAFGNVVGSSIFNILVILGISAIIYPINIHKGTAWKEIPFSLLGAVITFLLAASVWINGKQNLDLNSTANFSTLGASEGLLLLSIFAVFMYYIFGISKNQGQAEAVKQMSTVKSSLYLLLGIAGLSISAKYLVTDAAVEIARIFNVSEALIGLTLVSIGTGLPELATSVSAALKKNTDIAIGNIIGSNIFNVLLILGSTLVIKPIAVSGENIADLIILIFTTLILFVLTFSFQRYNLYKKEGYVMLALYFAYFSYIILR
jgi:cation:H+ antiporter